MMEYSLARSISLPRTQKYVSRSTYNYIWFIAFVTFRALGAGFEDRLKCVWTSV